MADITLCSNNECPLRALCRRTLLSPSDYQSWARFQPIVKRKSVSCEFFLERELNA